MQMSNNKNTLLLNKVIHKFKLNVKEIREVSDSHSSDVVIVEQLNGVKVVIKIPFNRSKFLKEKKVIEIINNKLPVPKIIDYYDEGTQGCAALLLSYIDGKTKNDILEEEALFELGRILGGLHQINSNYFGDIVTEDNEGEFVQNIMNDSKKNITINSWIPIMNASFRKWIPYCEKVLAPDVLQKSVDLFNEIQKGLPSPDGPCLIHMDFRLGNILFDNNKIIGLIDFETAKFGASEIDFVKIKRLILDENKKINKNFAEGYSSIRPLPDLINSLPYYELYNMFAAVGWCVKRKQIESEFCYDNVNKIISII